mmetsp:Transcript_28775/g.54328  ORF Transcript_28775/g.54328 Transcript_28775/m.54328 type:complete len:134 (+) Transcript_28775:3-404(+)
MLRIHVLFILAFILPLSSSFGLTPPSFIKTVEKHALPSLVALSIVTSSALPLPAFSVPPPSPTTFISGKSPTPPKENSTKGTRKDPTFLRAVSQCKSECEIKSSLDKTECLQKCQDAVCGSYEQCSFAIIRLN